MKHIVLSHQDLSFKNNVSRVRKQLFNATKCEILQKTRQMSRGDVENIIIKDHNEAIIKKPLGDLCSPFYIE